MKLPFGYELVKRKTKHRLNVKPGKDTIVVAYQQNFGGDQKAARAKQKLCKNGHLKGAANTVHVGGQDRCRTCYLAYSAKKKAERAAKNGGQK